MFQYLSSLKNHCQAIAIYRGSLGSKRAHQRPTLIAVASRLIPGSCLGFLILVFVALTFLCLLLAWPPTSQAQLHASAHCSSAELRFSKPRWASWAPRASTDICAPPAQLASLTISPLGVFEVETWVEANRVKQRLCSHIPPQGCTRTLSQDLTQCFWAPRGVTSHHWMQPDLLTTVSSAELWTAGLMGCGCGWFLISLGSSTGTGLNIDMRA